MKKIILPIMAIAAALSSASTYAQSKAFAITSQSRGSFNWNAVREIDLTTGEVLNTYYDQTANKAVEVFNTTNTRLSSTGETRALPMAEGVAAAAFDGKNNRLYYTTMRGTELRYFDLGDATGKIVYNQKDYFLPTANRYDEGNVITRMAFASDGFGYALTNDGNHLIRFSADNKATVTDLGALVDAEPGAAVSVHSQCTSWGGDMVGDIYGNLYLVTYKNHIFKINPQTRVANYVGAIKGLPTEFTSNGMAVSGDGEVALSSANLVNSYYRLNISTLQANAFNKTGANVYNTSDLANSGLLFQNAVSVGDVKAIEDLRTRAISVYPNPVVSRAFNLNFEKLTAGQYHLLLTDALGRAVVTKTITISSAAQVERVTLPRSAAGGMYMIKLIGNDKSSVFNEKLVVQ